MSNNVKTEHELNEMILAITARIQKEHPELSKYLAEMPVSIPDEARPEINQQNLQKYYDSLKSILQKYTIDKRSDLPVKPV
jgi:hypothetical protein